MIMKLLGALVLVWLAAMVKGQDSGSGSGDDMTDEEPTSGLVDGNINSALHDKSMLLYCL